MTVAHQRFVTWNVDSIRVRLDQVIDWIDRHQPDVIGLQETKVGVRRFPLAPFVDRGYDVVCTDNGGLGGVAMMSRIGLEDPVVGFPGAKAPLNEPRSVSATCGGYRVHTVYAPNGRKTGTRHHEIKIAWLQLLVAWLGLDGLDDGRPTILMGDLNVAPSDIDVWDADRYRKRNLTSPAERRVFGELLSGDLVDVVRSAYPDQRIYTWWNRRGDFYESDRGWRLDHILVDSATARQVAGVAVDRSERGRSGSSDHAPVFFDLTAVTTL